MDFQKMPGYSFKDQSTHQNRWFFKWLFFFLQYNLPTETTLNQIKQEQLSSFFRWLCGSQQTIINTSVLHVSKRRLGPVSWCHQMLVTAQHREKIAYYLPSAFNMPLFHSLACSLQPTAHVQTGGTKTHVHAHVNAHMHAHAHTHTPLTQSLKHFLPFTFSAVL